MKTYLLGLIFIISSVHIFAISKSEESALRAQLAKAQANVIAAKLSEEKLLKEIQKSNIDSRQNSVSATGKADTAHHDALIAESQQQDNSTNATVAAELANERALIAALQVKSASDQMIALLDSNKVASYSAMFLAGIGFLTLLIKVITDSIDHRRERLELAAHRLGEANNFELLKDHAIRSSDKLKEIEHNTDSISDELVRVTGESEFEKGRLKGKEEAEVEKAK